MVIHEKRSRDEAPDSSPNKKGKIDDSKRKETMLPPEAKKAKSNRIASRGTMRPIVPGESTSARPWDVLGSGASILVSDYVAEKIQARLILPSDKEKVDKLSLDQVITKFLHIVGF